MPLILFILLNVFIKVAVVVSLSLPLISTIGKIRGDLTSRPLIPLSPVPGLSGLNFDPLSLKNVVDFSKGWGVFNLGAEVDDVILTLQNAKTNYAPQVLKPNDLRTFSKSSWDGKEKTIIVIHGYAEDGTESPFSSTQKIMTAYIEAKRPENLVFVDWHSLARQVNYFQSAINTEKVGLYVAELLIFLRNSNYVHSLTKDVHIVGFSLGAHVAGIAAYYAGNFIEEPVGRVTGLDPAGPGFRSPLTSLESRLDAGDALFVDVMHSNMGELTTNFGTPIQSGHVDHYPNGGKHQPGCELLHLGEVLGVCSHLKAPIYFSNTILGKVYVGCPCSGHEDYLRGACGTCEKGVKMGEFIDPSARGKYYLTIPEGE